VIVGSRDVDKARRTVSRTRAARGGSYRDAAAGADVVILAVPWLPWTRRSPSSGS
jgi:predicted dinucleotide-binding enzyme